MVLLPIITGVSCAMSLYLMVRDAEDQQKLNMEGADPGTTKPLTIPAVIYSVACMILTVLIAVFLPQVYPENGVWVNVKRLILLSVMWPVAYIDFKTLRIPNLFVVYGLVCRVVILIFEFFLDNPYIWPSFISEVIAAVALLVAAGVCALVVPDGIGFGDMKLFVVMGLMLGLDGIWGAIFLALIVSFFIAVYVLVTKKKTRKDAIPFGPALVIGTYLSICLSGM